MNRIMDIKFYMKFNAKPIWNIVSDIRNQIKTLVEKKDFSLEVIESLETTAMELFENAIKYGISTEDATDVSLEISYDNSNELQISVSNGIESEESLYEFLDLLQIIKTTENLESLYMDRLREIAINPKSGKSHLGIYRIAYETGFALDYKISGKKLTITAVKKIEEV